MRAACVGLLALALFSEAPAQWSVTVLNDGAVAMTPARNLGDVFSVGVYFDRDDDCQPTIVLMQDYTSLGGLSLTEGSRREDSTLEMWVDGGSHFLISKPHIFTKGDVQLSFFSDSSSELLLGMLKGRVMHMKYTIRKATLNMRFSLRGSAASMSEAYDWCKSEANDNEIRF